MDGDQIVQHFTPRLTDLQGEILHLLGAPKAIYPGQ